LPNNWRREERRVEKKKREEKKIKEKRIPILIKTLGNIIFL
jgi:hypothetical protein